MGTDRALTPAPRVLRKSPSMATKEAQLRESIDSTLAKNLVAARTIAGLTQHELAAAAGISRATIAQLETGSSDPRLSTVVDLAGALGIAPIILLVSVPEVEALAALRDGSPDHVHVSPRDLLRLRDYVASGMLKDRVRAARLGAAIARSIDPDSPAVAITAGLFSASLPGAGTTIGAALGRKLSQ
jgi:transcriptional regulator with XRE-family HTH domain